MRVFTLQYLKLGPICAYFQRDSSRYGKYKKMTAKNLENRCPFYICWLWKLITSQTKYSKDHVFSSFWSCSYLITSQTKYSKDHVFSSFWSCSYFQCSLSSLIIRILLGNLATGATDWGFTEAKINCPTQGLQHVIHSPTKLHII